MGRKMDVLLMRRGFRASKFKTVAKQAISRLATLKNQHQVRSANARFDVIQLLKLGYQDRALLRVEYVIKEQNMLDVFVMIEGYIHLLTEELALLQDNNNKECPEELEEAVSSLIFAATRCGEFPELKHMREIFTSGFGKDFVARAAHLHNNCKVNFKMIQRLLARQPSSEHRFKVLKEIASENGITLHLEVTKSSKAEPETETDLLATSESEQEQTTSYESAHLDKADSDQQLVLLYQSTPARSYDGSSSNEMDPKEAETERKLSVSSNDSDKDNKMELNLSIQSEPYSDEEATEIEELPYETPNSVLLKAQEESSDHPRFESSQLFRDLGQDQHSGMERKLMSVRTIPVLRG